MTHVKNTRANQIVTRVEDMIMAKKDALSAKYSLSGKAFGVLAVDVY